MRCLLLQQRDFLESTCLRSLGSLVRCRSPIAEVRLEGCLLYTFQSSKSNTNSKDMCRYRNLSECCNLLGIDRVQPKTVKSVPRIEGYCTFSVY